MTYVSAIKVMDFAGVLSTSMVEKVLPIFSVGLYEKMTIPTSQHGFATPGADIYKTRQTSMTVLYTNWLAILPQI